DCGVWEVRGPRRRFTYSSLMTWVAFERAGRIAQQRGLPAPLGAWRQAADRLVHRYHNDGSDASTEPEGTFNLCSFWYVEALTRAGRLDQARHTFEKMLTYANHLGLYAEEIGASGEALGNFPQAFTHLGL